MDLKSCCTPTAGHPHGHTDAKIAPAQQAPQIAIIDIPGGRGLIGTDTPVIASDEESPCRRKAIKPFRMMQTTVTNAMFAAFVEDTGYVSEAEKFGWSFVFYSDVAANVALSQGVVGTEWWRRIDGACWWRPCGPGSDLEVLQEHPVTHVSWRDARAFAKWAGGRLPTEAEWEHAARGGLGDVPFPWGAVQPDDDKYQPCNIWQGEFPQYNSGTDGYLTTAPARSFDPNGYGLYNMCGNVWEWTSDPMKLRSLSRGARDRMRALKGGKVLKGGSFLCHQSYCFRYRIAARTFNTPDTTTAHQGFRLAFDLPRP